MFTLHVDLSLEPGTTELLERIYREVFRPPLSKQPGFSETQLLRPRLEVQGYRLVIAFEDEEFQKKWVATDLHQEVWPKMESFVGQYSVNAFESV
jgi:heme-degrading monooxygenase HmoA